MQPCVKRHAHTVAAIGRPPLHLVGVEPEQREKTFAALALAAHALVHGAAATVILEELVRG